MNVNWYARRRLIYGLGLLFVVVSILLYLFRDTLFPVPMCTDGKQNGYESGVDCGGVCSLRCKAEVIPLTVTWSKALYTGPFTYDLVALVSNRNINNAAPILGYGFTLYDAQENIIKQVYGTTTSPIDGDFPVIMQNVPLSEPPTSVRVQLFDGLHYASLEKPTQPTIVVGNTRYEAGTIPRVYTTIRNTKRVTITDLHVRVIVFDGNDNAYAVGETVIPFLDKEEAKEIAFTWNVPFKEEPTKVRVYPIFDPFSRTQ